jgi:hypothetical protein
MTAGGFPCLCNALSLAEYDSLRSAQSLPCCVIYDMSHCYVTWQAVGPLAG